MKCYECQSDFAKKYVAQGRTEEEARTVLTVLLVRGRAVPDAVRERILSQKNPERLECWLEKAAVATSAALLRLTEPLYSYDAQIKEKDYAIPRPLLLP